MLSGDRRSPFLSHGSVTSRFQVFGNRAVPAHFFFICIPPISLLRRCSRFVRRIAYTFVCSAKKDRVTDGGQQTVAVVEGRRGCSGSSSAGVSSSSSPPRRSTRVHSFFFFIIIFLSLSGLAAQARLALCAFITPFLGVIRIGIWKRSSRPAPSMPQFSLRQPVVPLVPYFRNAASFLRLAPLNAGSCEFSLLNFEA